MPCAEKTQRQAAKINKFIWKLKFFFLRSQKYTIYDRSPRGAAQPQRPSPGRGDRAKDKINILEIGAS